ncbi:hypothetical protein QLX08_009318 [Tetragonisca angustula]|uniref:Uncharacterized protein n=1 Tax=Tetragonisca angustula TaxID=166442 RepID=A0AAW0ZI11_9HYME
MWNMTEKDASKESTLARGGGGGGRPVRWWPHGGGRPLVERTWLERDGIWRRAVGASERRRGWTAEREREAPWTERAEKEEVGAGERQSGGAQGNAAESVGER